MKDNEYWKELTIYYFTDYELNKKMDLKAEEIKKSSIRFLEKTVNMLKERLPKEVSNKMGKVVKLKPR